MAWVAPVRMACFAPWNILSSDMGAAATLCGAGAIGGAATASLGPLSGTPTPGCSAPPEHEYDAM